MQFSFLLLYECANRQLLSSNSFLPMLNFCYGYSIFKTGKKYIEACDKPTKQRLKTAIMAIPNGDIKKLKGYDNWYRLRVGNLRILFEFTDEAVIISDILPRGQVYKGI